MNGRIIKTSIVALLILTGTISSIAQNALEGSKGMTSIDYTQYGGGIITLNTADKKIELGYINYKIARMEPTSSGTGRLNYSEKPFWYGVSVSGRATNGYATIFNQGKISPSSDLTLRFGKRLNNKYVDNILKLDINEERIKLGKQLAQPGLSDERKQQIQDRLQQLTDELPAIPELWFIARSGYNVSKFNLYDNTRPFNEQFSPTRFDGFFGNIGLNYWHPNLFGKNVIFLAGITAGLRRQNNLDDLNEVTAEDVTTITNANTTRSFKGEKVGFAGSYRAFTSIPINFDMYFKPHNLLNAAFSFYGRINSFQDASVMIT